MFDARYKRFSQFFYDKKYYLVLSFIKRSRCLYFPL